MGSVTGGSSSQQSSTPVNETPSAYASLQPLVASSVANLLSGGIPQYNPLNPGSLTNTQNLPATTPSQFPTGSVAGNGAVPAGAQSGINAAVAGAQANPNYVNAGTSGLVAPLSSQQLSLIGQAVNTANPNNPLMSSASGALQNILNPNFLNVGTNPYLAGAIQSALYPTIRNFQSTTIPELLSRYTGGNQQVQGQGSSSFANAADLASLDLNQSLLGTASGMASSAYQQGIGQQLQAASQASGLQTSELQNLVTAGQQAALPQLVQDLGIQRGLQQYNNNINTLMEALRIAAGGSSPTVAVSSQGTSQSTPSLLTALGL